MDVLIYLEEMNPLQLRVIAIAKPKGGVEKPLFLLRLMIYQEVFRSKVGI